MSKLNKKAVGESVKTENLSGYPAYALPKKLKLVTEVLTSFVGESKFYGDNTDEMKDLIVSLIQVDPAFVSNLAVYARREFNMRSVSHILTAYLAHEPKGKPFARRTLNGVAIRGDDLTEIAAFYLDTFKDEPFPASLKKGVNDVMTSFDEYVLGKYKGTGKSVTMKDLICLCHPKPQSGEQEALFKRCLENKLETPFTWETELSAKGNNKATWEGLINSGRVGYMALLRNLRNIINANPSNIDKVWQTIENPDAVRKSRQLPFRFLSAYKELRDMGGVSSRAFDALESAVISSVENMERLPGRTVIAVDISGSMSDTLSRNGKIRYVDVGYLLGMLAGKICEDVIFYTFNAAIQQLPVSKYSGVLESTCRVCPTSGTNMHLPFDRMMRDNVKADRIIIFSDEECNSVSPWDSRYEPVNKIAKEYRKKSGCDIWVHAVDLAGYGSTQFYGGRTNIVAGWSEKVFSLFRLAEIHNQSMDKAIVAEIENYSW